MNSGFVETNQVVEIVEHKIQLRTFSQDFSQQTSTRRQDVMVMDVMATRTSNQREITSFSRHHRTRTKLYRKQKNGGGPRRFKAFDDEGGVNRDQMGIRGSIEMPNPKPRKQSYVQKRHDIGPSIRCLTPWKSDIGNVVKMKNSNGRSFY